MTIAPVSAQAKSSKEVCKRIGVERKIARKCAQAFLAAGYLLGVNDGEETTLRRSKSLKTVMAALGTTDEDYLLVYDPAELQPSGGCRRVGHVYLVYGNSGWDLISDYSAAEALFPRFEAILEPVFEYAAKFDV